MSTANDAPSDEVVGETSDKELFLAACKRGAGELLEEIWAKGQVSINDADELGNTGLHYAAAGGHLEIINRLIELQADPNAQNFNYDTPLHKAAWNGWLAVVNALLNAGSHPKAQNQDYKTPDELASSAAVGAAIQNFAKGMEEGDDSEIATLGGDDEE